MKDRLNFIPFLMKEGAVVYDVLIQCLMSDAVTEEALQANLHHNTCFGRC
jgi:hypothetical protein